MTTLKDIATTLAAHGQREAAAEVASISMAIRNASRRTAAGARVKLKEIDGHIDDADNSIDKAMKGLEAQIEHYEDALKGDTRSTNWQKDLADLKAALKSLGTVRKDLKNAGGWFSDVRELS